MLKRKAYNKMISWKKSNHRNALCIIGARQIGKTTLIRYFGKENYKCFIEINFITDEAAKSIFDNSIDVDTILTNLTAYLRKPMEPGNTLILFDEIQACPKARTAIKFLVEDGRFDYIESGSLLGIQYTDVSSYPVGFEDIYLMYPLDFEEFLWAVGVQESTINYLENCFNAFTPVTDSVHDTINKLFYLYEVVGGMPQVVVRYILSHDITQVIELQKSILEEYRQDISKYSTSNAKMKIKDIFDSIPSQLNDKNRRFFLSSIDNNARLDRYINYFKWLDDAGVAIPCYNVEIPQQPLSLNKKHSIFKLFSNDTGLLCASCMDNIQFDILKGNIEINNGSIFENVIAQQLKANGYNLYYYNSKKHGEIDFVIGDNIQTSLLEVKSGKNYKKHAALDNISSIKDYKFEKKYVLSTKNIEVENNIIYLPCYMFIFIRPKKVTTAKIYDIDISKLNV